MKERMKLPVSVHLFLRKENEILLLKRYNTGYEDGNYSVVAGHIEGNESVFEAMIRETEEEAGISIERHNLIPIQVMHRKKSDGEYIDYFFVSENWEGTVENMEPNKCDDLSWFPIDSLPENMVKYVEAAIKNYRKKILFSEHGWQ